jgi:DNA-binding GntR family transcriptional regulator
MPPSAIDSELTLNANAARLIRSDIIACRLLPNERLRVESLRARYGMGTSPIREALMRLEAEGLVALEHNKGFRVAEVSREKLIDLMHTRVEIEAVALRWSLENADVAWEANLLGAFHRLSRQPKVDPANAAAMNEAWRREHADFHAALVVACGSPTLLTIYSRLFEQAERYVALSIMASGSPRDDVGEHRQLMRSALDRDLAKAVELNRAHISRTLEKVSASLVPDGRLRKPGRKSVRA